MWPVLKLKRPQNMRPSSMAPAITFIYRRTLWFLGATHQAQNPLPKEGGFGIFR